MARELSIRIKIEDTDQARQALASVEKGLNDVEQAGGKVAKTVGDPSRKDSLVASLGSLRATIAGLGIGIAIDRTVEWGSKLADLSAKTGISTQALQAFERAGAVVGVSLDQMANGVLMLQRRLSTDEGAIKAVEQLGLKTEDLLRMKPDQMFLSIAQAVGGIEDPAKRTTAAYELMGRSSAELIPVMVGDLEHLTSRQLALTDEQIQGLDRLDDAWETTKILTLSALGQILGEIVDTWTVDVPNIWRSVTEGLTALVGKFRDFALDVVRYVQATYQDIRTWLYDRFLALVVIPLGVAIDRVRSFFSSAGVFIVQTVQNLYMGVKSWLVDRFDAIVMSVKGKVEAVTGFFAGMYDKVVGNSYVPDMVTEIGTWFARLDDQMVQPARRVTSDVSSSFSHMALTVSREIAMIVSAAQNGLNGVTQYVSQFARDFVSTALDILVPGLGQLVNYAWPLIEQGLAKIWEGIKAFWNSVKGLFNFFGSAPRDSPQDVIIDQATGQIIYDPNQPNNPTPGYDPGNPTIPDPGAWQPPPDPNDRNPGLLGFAGGTGGRYLDFGRGTLAMLHGRERVMTEAEGKAQQTATIILQVDRRTLAEAIVPVLPDVVRSYRLA